MTQLPRKLRVLFPEYDFDSLAWESDRDLVISRVLTKGDWDAVCWVRKQVDDGELRAWIMRDRGRHLDSRQLRFWELILELPHEQVDAWLEHPARALWEQRTRR